MVILTTSTDAQSFKVIPRSTPSSVTFQLTDKSKRTTSAVSVTVANSNGYMTLTGSFSLVEDRFYSFVIKSGSTIIYRGSIFCTDQTISTYTINKDVYTENVTTNEYVVI